MRLFALGLALLASSTAGPLARAPQALRAWVDVAAQVEQAASVDQSAPTIAAVPVALAHALSSSFALVLAPSFSSASLTSAWPTSASGREVLARKRALLI